MVPPFWMEPEAVSQGGWTISSPRACDRGQKGCLGQQSVGSGLWAEPLGAGAGAGQGRPAPESCVLTVF